MSGKKAKATPHVDHARPVLNQSQQTDAQKVAATQSTSASMQASPSWAAAPTVQAAVAKWGQDATALGAKAGVVAQLRLQLATAMGDLRVLRRNWTASTDHVLSTVNVFSQGSVDTVKSFSLEVQTRTPAGAPVAPANLTVTYGAKPGEALAKWKRGGKASHGFVVQYATDATNATTYSVLKPTTKSKYTLGGLTPGSTVYVRVAAIDPNAGQGPWSQWVSGPVA
jgi:hypothetical protein